MIETKKPENFVIDPPTGRADLLFYGSGMMLVAATFLGLAVAFGRAQPNRDASDVDMAIMIDLPPADASSRPPSDAPEAPEQQPARASISETPPDAVRPPEKPVDEPKPKQEVAPIKEPPLRPAPNPAAVLEQKREDLKPPPKPSVAPTVAPQEELAPTGSDALTLRNADQGEEGRPHASAHVITLWQKSLMRRLEIAKRSVGHAARSAGTVRIAFEINVKGAIISERIAESSGSHVLDDAASALVRLAAPFPAPPAGARIADMSFVLPIRFRQ